MDIFPETYNGPIFLLIVDFVKASLGWGGWGSGQQEGSNSDGVVWGVGSKRAATVVGWLGEWVARGQQQWWGGWGSG